jgi:hypothetical protein
MSRKTTLYKKVICEKCNKKFNISYKTLVKNENIICPTCKCKQTKLERYGDPHYHNSKQALQTMEQRYGKGNLTNREKAKQTCLKRFGVDIPMKNKKIQEKVKKTTLQKYGTENAFAAPSIKEKIKKIKLERYGYEHFNPQNNLATIKRWKQYRNDPKIIQKTIQEIQEKGLLCESVYNTELQEWEYKITCKKHNETWVWNRITTKKEERQLPYCKKCYAENASKQEKEIVEYIKSIYNGEIIENDRIQLNGKELDIWLPELKIAIEYNGTYWHGYTNKTQISFTEFKKNAEWKRLESEKLGIRLITIDECDYLDRPEVFKRFLYNVIIPKIKVYARKCEIKEIDTKTAKDFCECYHVNGFRGGKYKYGLFYKDELLIVAIFAHYKQNYECIRLCYKTGYNIIGGWAKIQKHFGKKFLHYVNLKYFRGENKTGCGYRFVFYPNIILHRNALQKKTSLYKYCKKIDKTKTDFENCLMNGIAICDLGNDIRWYNGT